MSVSFTAEELSTLNLSLDLLVADIKLNLLELDIFEDGFKNVSDVLTLCLLAQKKVVAYADSFGYVLAT